MNERLIIKNFGAIKEADIDIKRFMLLIGDQASGKSTIAKLLSIFRDIAFIQEGEKNGMFYFKNHNIHNYFINGDTYIEYENPDKYRIIIDKKNIIITKNPKFEQEINNELIRVRKLIEGVFTIRKGESSKEIIENDDDKLINDIYKNSWTNIFSLLNKQQYIPTERILFSIFEVSAEIFGDWKLPVFSALKEFGKNFFLAKNNIKTYPLDFLNITYKFENESKIYFDETHSIPLTESASGYQAIIPLIMVVHSFRNSNAEFIVEEPELNIFPTVQNNVIRFLIDSVNQNKGSKKNLVITTHSPYILSIFNNLLFAHIAAHNKKDNVNNVTKIINEKYWIDPNEFNSYYLSSSSGKSTQIFNIKTGLISSNELDNISEDLESEFNLLLKMAR